MFQMKQDGAHRQNGSDQKEVGPLLITRQTVKLPAGGGCDRMAAILA